MKFCCEFALAVLGGRYTPDEAKRRTRHALELRLGPSEGDPNAGECPDCGAPAGECWLPWTTKCRRAPCG